MQVNHSFSRFSFLFFLIVPFFLWTLLPTFLLKGVYIDVLENWEWGRHFQWGYDKDPYLAAWLTYWVLHSVKDLAWLSYLLSQISVVIASLAIWRLASRILPAAYAPLSAILLTTTYFFTVGSTELNDDVVEISLWALTCLFFYDAVKEQSVLKWLLVGLFAGLASMDKYFTLILLLSMFAFLLINSEGRLSFKKPGLYLGIIVFLPIVIPNFIWLIKHSFVAINYAFNAASCSQLDSSVLMNHFVNPLVFCLIMIGFFIPLFLIVRGCFGGEKETSCEISSYSRQYLSVMFFAPFILVLSFLIVTGSKFRLVWATPMFNMAGIALFAGLKPRLTLANLKKYFMTLFLFSIFWIGAFLFSEKILPHIVKGVIHRFEIYPGEKVATVLTNEWHRRYHMPLQYVAGNRVHAVNISYFSKDHPFSYFEWKPEFSQWINEADLRKRGALFVWTVANDYDLHLRGNIAARFPKASQPIIYQFDWAFHDWLAEWFHFQKPKPLKIAVSFLAPEI